MYIWEETETDQLMSKINNSNCKTFHKFDIAQNTFNLFKYKIND